MTEMAFGAETGWRRRGLAFLRAILFLALFVAANIAIKTYEMPLHRGIKSFEGHILVEMVLFGLTAMALTALMARFSGRAFLAYGLGGAHRLRNLGVGLAAGIVLLTIQLLLMAALGCFAFGTASPLDTALLSNALLFAAAFGAVAFTEETLVRGYVLVELSRALSFWPAAILVGLLFGVPHWLKGDGEDLMGGILVALDGVVMAYAVRVTGSLWFVIGEHAGWDYAQSFLFGVADSGTVSHGALMHPHIAGPTWLSGGSVGPEGSVLFLLQTLGLAAVALSLGRRTSRQGGNAVAQAA